MAYLHCHNCGWSQDDFWSKNYNPLKSLVDLWAKDLLDKDLDNEQGYDSWDENGNHFIEQKTLREVISRAVGNAAQDIRNMKFRSMDEFLLKKHIGCPKCGSSKDFDVD